MLGDRPSGWRRWRFTLLILAAACIIWVWQSRVDDRLEREATTYVRALLDANREKRGEADLLQETNPIVARQVSSRLGELIAGDAAITSTISRGDDPEFGDGRATHLATLSTDGKPRLLLRLFHPGDAGHIQVLGCTVIEESTAP